MCIGRLRRGDPVGEREASPSTAEVSEAMEIRYFDDEPWVKVGRLKPGDEEIIHLFVDGSGELVMITRQEAQGLNDEAVEMDRHGKMVVVAQVDGVEYCVFVWQLGNLLEKWPRKKAAVYRVR